MGSDLARNAALGIAPAAARTDTEPDRFDSIEPVIIDCDNCAVRGPGCRDCVVSVLVGAPENLLGDECAALDVLAEVGLAPRLRLVPIKRGGSGIAS